VRIFKWKKCATKNRGRKETVIIRMKGDTDYKKWANLWPGYGVLYWHILINPRDG
jgi:hypothetical protein